MLGNCTLGTRRKLGPDCIIDCNGSIAQLGGKHLLMLHKGFACITRVDNGLYFFAKLLQYRIWNMGSTCLGTTARFAASIVSSCSGTRGVLWVSDRFTKLGVLVSQYWSLSMLDVMAQPVYLMHIACRR